MSNSKFGPKGCLVCALFSMGALQANPGNGTVISGDASFYEPDAYTLNVGVSSSRTIIEWDDFSISPNETTYFSLPSSDSAVLNRVTSSNVSSIYGSLGSNGQIYLVNPNGIVFGANATISASSFVASTLDVDNTEFLNASDMTFTGTENSDVFLINYGTITATDGDCVLMSYQISNTGTINAENGRVVEGAGVEIILQPNSSDQRISIVPHSYLSTVPIGVDDGSYIAAMKAELQADGNAYQLAIKHEGWVDAAGAITGDADIYFASIDGKTTANGVLFAQNNDGIGGDVAVLGTQVEVGDSCEIYVSAQYGGGTVAIGGGWGGEDPSLMNATFTTVNSNAQVDCDALVSGAGGTVVVWANDTTTYDGTIYARGGVVDGNGGNVEVSGVSTLNYNGAVDVHAFNGNDGVLALDPKLLFYSPKQVAGLIEATPVIK
jgi:filamentous hemagglutinin family protein